ncbi:unnamed protein product [Linum tenue]|uniref:Uncharacterized protein n=1 Tax=Linum tenue TaxID=586396 RepID=A0AAV0L6Q8_9ROSI|nr:unnamed protein product [Linum tenue]
MTCSCRYHYKISASYDPSNNNRYRYKCKITSITSEGCCPL